VDMGQCQQMSDKEGEGWTMPHVTFLKIPALFSYFLPKKGHLGFFISLRALQFWGIGTGFLLLPREISP